jgi:hypothetical protein
MSIYFAAKVARIVPGSLKLSVTHATCTPFSVNGESYDEVNNTTRLGKK